MLMWVFVKVFGVDVIIWSWCVVDWGGGYVLFYLIFWVKVVIGVWWSVEKLVEEMSDWLFYLYCFDFFFCCWWISDFDVDIDGYVIVMFFLIYLYVGMLWVMKLDVFVVIWFVCKGFCFE